MKGWKARESRVTPQGVRFNITYHVVRRRWSEDMRKSGGMVRRHRKVR